MKELEIKTGDKIEIVDQKQQKSQLKLLKSIKPHQGHKCWELNTETGEVKEAEFKEENVDFISAENKKIALRKKIITKDGYIYLPALNKKNAIKKFKKLLSLYEQGKTVQ